MTIKQLTRSEFCQKVADLDSPNGRKFVGKRPVVVDFYAQWCGPCNALSPVIEDLATRYAGLVDFYKVDVDKEVDLAQTFSVRTIPTLVFFPTLGMWTTHSGYVSRKNLADIIDVTLLEHTSQVV